MPKGTAGAVALDANGCIASVTSTGGRTNKPVGRIGDTAYGSRVLGGRVEGPWDVEEDMETTAQKRNDASRWYFGHRRWGCKSTISFQASDKNKPWYFIRYNAAA